MPASICPSPCLSETGHPTGLELLARTVFVHDAAAHLDYRHGRTKKLIQSCPLRWLALLVLPVHASQIWHESDKLALCRDSSRVSTQVQRADGRQLGHDEQHRGHLQLCNSARHADRVPAHQRRGAVRSELAGAPRSACTANLASKLGLLRESTSAMHELMGFRCAGTSSYSLQSPAQRQRRPTRTSRRTASITPTTPSHTTSVRVPGLAKPHLQPKRQAFLLPRLRVMFAAPACMLSVSASMLRYQAY